MCFQSPFEMARCFAEVCRTLSVKAARLESNRGIASEENKEMFVSSDASATMHFTDVCGPNYTGVTRCAHACTAWWLCCIPPKCDAAL
jgi:hypothetical protein